MKYTQVQFTNQTAQQNEILIAMLADIGFEGFEENENELKAFINQSEFNKETLDAVTNSNNFSYSLTEIEQQNWNAEWESSFEPVIIDDFAAIRAGFHKPVKNVVHEIIITPKMSFGTGHHATTYLMMEQMSRLNFKDKAVLDFGTGTGVLAILAVKMGATSVLAIDNDEWSIDNAKENIENNSVENITIKMAESIITDAKYDIILANINLNVILQHMDVIAGVCNPGAEILLSGFLSADEQAIKASLISNGLIFNEVKQKKDWICIKANRP
ncbi:50S ribosomal protein L11 methyltransferase [Ferruginibacter sp. SUN106]|uniref:50S ribosomal protein L11 methyltransferase n=1 Tax=Ferruginibacter sp. SUN106 TaxID=2978348 RepID=UPI003D36040D